MTCPHCGARFFLIGGKRAGRALRIEQKQAELAEQGCGLASCTIPPAPTTPTQEDPR